MLHIDNNTRENTTICRFEGRLDTIACLKYAEEISTLTSNLKTEADTGEITGHPIVFDLRDVNYISSSFIRICVNTAKQISKGQFSIIHCDPFIKKTFKIAGLDDLLNIS